MKMAKVISHGGHQHIFKRQNAQRIINLILKAGVSFTLRGDNLFLSQDALTKHA